MKFFLIISLVFLSQVLVGSDDSSAFDGDTDRTCFMRNSCSDLFTDKPMTFAEYKKQKYAEYTAILKIAELKEQRRSGLEINQLKNEVGVLQEEVNKGRERIAKLEGENIEIVKNHLNVLEKESKTLDVCSKLIAERDDLLSINSQNVEDYNKLVDRKNKLADKYNQLNDRNDELLGVNSKLVDDYNDNVKKNKQLQVKQKIVIAGLIGFIMWTS